MTEYYTSLTKIWQELDIFEPTNWCGECAGKYAKLVEKQHTYDFLISLNKDLDEVRGRMLGTHPLPQIEEIFTEVHREESKRKYILGDSKTPLQTKASALAAKDQESQHTTENSSNSQHACKGNLWCDFCQRSNHNRENCWKLHGRPANQSPKPQGTFRRDTCAYQSTAKTQKLKNNDNIGGLNLNKEQIEKFYKLLTPEKTTSNSLIAQKGNFLTALKCTKTEKEPWIIDSGASDHMIGCTNLFSLYIPSSVRLKVKIADGSLSPIAGFGTIKINLPLSLSLCYMFQTCLATCFL